MAEKDTTEKVLLSFDDVFADVINGFLFHGEQVIAPEDLRSDVVMTTYDDNDQIRAQERDVSKFWVKGDLRILLSGIENQSQPDRDMPLRVIGYDGASYRGQLVRDGGQSARYPVMTLVLYFGDEEWNQPQTLKGCFDHWDAVPDAVKPLIQDYRIHILDVPRTDPEDVKLFRSDFRVVADFFVQKHRTNRYEPSEEKLAYVKQVCDLLSAVTKDSSYAEAYKSTVHETEGGAVNMCEIVNQFRSEGEAISHAKGLALGIAEGKINMLLKLVSHNAITVELAEKEASIILDELAAQLESCRNGHAG